MSEAKECDICHKFYKKYERDDFNGFVLVGGEKQEGVDLCPDCQKVLSKILYHGYPKWLPEELYDPKRFGDSVLVKTRNSQTGSMLSKIYIATKRERDWIEQGTGQRLLNPVAYFACLNQIDDSLGGSELE